MNGAANGNAAFPPPKTDKPRPHVCGTCGRSFARLEHLKRHERSHTKEKPFECPECTRCFARRDLLLRHQQKLHMTTTPSTRTKGGRRESTTSNSGTTVSGRVRKNSTANNAGTSAANGSMRPRANTISHVDNTTLGMLAAANATAARQGNGLNAGHNQFGSHGLPGPGGFSFRGMSTAAGHHGNPHGLPKLDTHVLNHDMSSGLRTAPPFGDFGGEFGMENMLFGPGTTINPAQLHFTDSPHSLVFDTPTSPLNQAFPGLPPAQAMLDEEGNFEWMHGFDHHMSFDHGNENAIAGSSPSAISTGSRSGISEVMLDGSNNSAQNPGLWQNPVSSHSQIVPTSLMEISGAVFPELLPPESLSQLTFQDHLGGNDQYFSTAMPMSSHVHGLSNQFYPPPVTVSADTPTNSAASVSSSNRQSSVTSVSTDSITDATRQALLATLSQQSKFGHGHRKYSQPTISSPLSPGFSARPCSASGVSLPSTYDLQRYVAAYIQYFHPHLPFLHVPSLSFDSPAYTSYIRPSSGMTGFQQSSIAGGGGCLILAMAAIGALYEFENAASKELFEMAKRMIKIYLEERRKADMSASVNGSNSNGEVPAHNTPLWLVQAMLLNVIYGHNCGDKTSAENASTHCAALVSLARAAELTRGQSSQTAFPRQNTPKPGSEDIRMTDDGWTPHATLENQDEWHVWKLAEERKRTLYGVFILSSMLVSAYNHAPALTNSELRLDLPCDEDLWAADSPAAWYAMGGNAIAEQRATPFATALSSLLTASQRRQRHQNHMSQGFSQMSALGAGVGELSPSEIQPSTFGCLVLINALHNYIWETRQRHLGRQWTMQETESMHAHIEPALAAWQEAWASNPQHSLERPNPFGFGPLSADSIPLLDLAYVRLFVNLGRSKEAFWQWDFDGMADEIARGSEIIQHADHSPRSYSNNGHSSTGSNTTYDSSPVIEATSIKVELTLSSSDDHVRSSGQSSKRERHLRKAAFHAAHSLSLSDKLGVTFADFNSRELPIQSAMCAFDCAQVLAEWVCTVQERVGRYLGILGKDEIDFGQVPGIMLLEDEDCKLLEKIDQILNSAEVKMAIDHGSLATLSAITPNQYLAGAQDCGYGSKILLVTAYMLDRAAVWPGKTVSKLHYVHACHTNYISNPSNGSISRNPSSSYEKPSRSLHHKTGVGTLRNEKLPPFS